MPLEHRLLCQGATSCCIACVQGLLVRHLACTIATVISETRCSIWHLPIAPSMPKALSMPKSHDRPAEACSLGAFPKILAPLWGHFLEGLLVFMLGKRTLILRNAHYRLPVKPVNASESIRESRRQQHPLASPQNVAVKRSMSATCLILKVMGATCNAILPRIYSILRRQTKSSGSGCGTSVRWQLFHTQKYCKTSGLIS